MGKTSNGLSNTISDDGPVKDIVKKTLTKKKQQQEEEQQTVAEKDENTDPEQTNEGDEEKETANTSGDTEQKRKVPVRRKGVRTAKAVKQIKELQSSPKFAIRKKEMVDLVRFLGATYYSNNDTMWFSSECLLLIHRVTERYIEHILESAQDIMETSPKKGLVAVKHLNAAIRNNHSLPAQLRFVMTGPNCKLPGNITDEQRQKNLLSDPLK